MASFIAATATASWFNDNGNAPWFDGDDAEPPTAQVRPPLRVTSAPAEEAPVEVSAKLPPPSSSPAKAQKPKPVLDETARFMSPAKTTTAPIKPPQPKPTGKVPPDTPDPFRAAAAKARAIQKELQDSQTFRSFDADGDGKMDAGELQALLGLETEAEAQAILDRLDEDGDGNLDLSEVGDALSSLRDKIAQMNAPAEHETAAEQAANKARTSASMARKAQTDAIEYIAKICPSVLPQKLADVQHAAHGAD